MPGTTFETPSLLVMARSACGDALLVSVDVLFPGVGSDVPVGGVIVAVFTRAPVVPAGTTPVMVKVAVALTGSETSASMLPLPLAVAHEPPPAAAQVHVNEARAAGSVSCTRAPTTALGPAFETTTV